MSEIYELNRIMEQLNMMIDNYVDPSCEDFIVWRTKTERVLAKIYGDNSMEYKEFSSRIFKSPVFTANEPYKNGLDIKVCHETLIETRAKMKVYIEELEEKQTEKEKDMDIKGNSSLCDYSKVFVVHGHDGELKERVARLIEKQEIEPIILSEKTSRGMTVIEKIEMYADSTPAAICLFTADDCVEDGTRRARQNVVFETGYFYGKIGRENTIVVADEEVMNLSDLKGIVYVNRNNWELDVLKELRDIGYTIDLNKLYVGD